jgi:hypothetical protein
MPKPKSLSKFFKDDFSDDSETEIKDSDDLVYSIRDRIKSRQDALKLDKDEDESGFQEYDFPDPYDERYVVLYRGIQYSSDFFSNKSRRKSALFVSQNGRDIYSSSIFRNADLKKKDIGDYVANELSKDDIDLLNAEEVRTKNFLEFLYQRTDLKPKINSDYVYGSLFLALIQINTNSYSKVDNYVDELRKFLVKNNKKFTINSDEIEILTNAFCEFKESESEDTRPDKKMMISTSVRSKIGVQYSLPYIEGDEIKGFDPEYDENGKPKYRIGGEVQILFIPESVYIKEVNKIGRMSVDSKTSHIYEKNSDEDLPEFTDLHFNKTRRIIHPDIRIIEQFELAFFNKIDGRYVIDSFPIYFPNFSKDFDSKYHKSQYGLSSKNYNEIKIKFTNPMNYDSAIEDLTKLLQDNYDKKIQDMVLNICQKTPISLVTPKIDSNGDIVMVRFLRNITIKKRFDQVTEVEYEKKEHEDLGANISINTSPAKNPKPLTVNSATKKSGSYLAQIKK